ncbi:hypothetical protein D3C86_1363210 [compost metagenome]
MATNSLNLDELCLGAGKVGGFGHGTDNTMHSLLVIIRQCPELLNEPFFGLVQLLDGTLQAHAGEDVQHINADLGDGCEVGRVRVSLAFFVAALGVARDAT